MDLIARGPNGRLDSMAACKLLWSGAVSFEEANVVWDGQAHRLQEPTIHDDVISLYQLSHQDVEAVLPDMLSLLATLERDKALSVATSNAPDDVRQVVATGRITGITVFLLQADNHPLIVELADKDTFQVRYDVRLCSLIPDLQELLCRMLCHLRAFRGDRKPFTVLFTKNGPQRRPRSDSSGADSMRAPIKPLDSRVEVELEELLDIVPYHTATIHTQSDATSDAAIGLVEDRTVSGSRLQPEDLQAITVLEASIYTTHALADATSSRIKDFEKTRAQVDVTKPDSKAVKRRASRSLSALSSDARAIRSLAIRSALYLGVGIALMWLGRMLIVDGDEILRLAAGAWNDAVGRATDLMSLTLGQTQSVGRHDSMELPTEAGSNVLRVIGFLVMGLGIVFPITRILRYKRRIDRERAFIQSHMGFIAELSHKQQLSAEMAYSEELGTWASSISHISHEIELAQSSLALLKQTNKRTREALAACQDLLGCKAPAAQPVSLSTKRSTTALVQSINAEYSEKERHERIVAYCNDAADIASRAEATEVNPS